MACRRRAVRRRWRLGRRLPDHAQNPDPQHLTISLETLDGFFNLLGPSGCEGIALVTVDLAASWQKALRAWVPHARVVFDRFHVERLASDAVDEVRRAEQRRVGAKAAKALKGTRFCLLKHPARLKPGEKRRLETLRRQNRALDRAYRLKDTAVPQTFK